MTLRLPETQSHIHTPPLFLYDTATYCMQAPLHTKEAYHYMCVCVCFLTYEGASFGVEFRSHADASAQVEHHEHGNNHDDALQQQQGVEVATKSVGEDMRMWKRWEICTTAGHRHITTHHRSTCVNIIKSYIRTLTSEEQILSPV